MNTEPKIHCDCCNIDILQHNFKAHTQTKKHITLSNESSDKSIFMTCVCGAVIRKLSYPGHEKSFKHKSYIN